MTALAFEILLSIYLGVLTGIIPALIAGVLGFFYMVGRPDVLRQLDRWATTPSPEPAVDETSETADATAQADGEERAGTVEFDDSEQRDTILILTATRVTVCTGNCLLISRNSQASGR